MGLIVPIRKAYPATKAVWFDTPALWGCDHTFFVEESGTEAIIYAKVYVKELGVFNLKPMYIQAAGVFLKVTRYDTIEVTLDPLFLSYWNTFSLNLTNATIEYEVKQSTTMLQVLTYFRDAFLHLGFSCTMDSVTNKLLISDVLCKYISITPPGAIRVVQPRLKGVGLYDYISDWSEVWSFTTA
jgi:hypothetical protein